MAPSSQPQKLHSSTYDAISPSRPELSTKGKTAIVTGGGTGIGAAIAQSLAKSGITHVALFGRTKKTLLEGKALVEAANANTSVWTYAVDIADAVATNVAVETFANATTGKIDILVANAGYLPHLVSIVESEPEDWWLGFETNVRGNYNLIRAFDPFAAPGAAVVHISTAAIYVPFIPGYSSYRASKSAATKVFDYYHHERPDLHHVQIHPGLQETPMALDRFGRVFEEMGYPFDDVEVAGDFVVWAVSDAAKFLNGRFVSATWDVDELKEMKAEVGGDPNKWTMGLL